MRRFAVRWMAAGLVATAAHAGVVVEMEVRTPDSPDAVGSERFYAEGEMVRMDPHRARGGGEMSAIFRDQTLWFVDHDKKQCQKIDREGVEQLSARLDQMMKQFEQMPPEQRAMMEKMMQGKMPGVSAPPSRRIDSGGTEQIGEYTCEVHTLYSDEKKVWEVCAADESVAADVIEAMDAFRAMSRFTESLQRVVRDSAFVGMIDTPYTEMDDLGFPVRVRTFDDKERLVSETTLASINRREIDAAVFEVPPGYKVKDLKDQLGK
ncbi:MAG TPA: DUF4412 domain-containing protein [Candidatus Polarisedimenticolaceae bacterium]|nr:DUF4412 domain-containing protein [Candidatus Polarisedimenticolaceae bacterium]